MDNLAKLRAKMAEAELPALLVTEPNNLRWTTGFTGSFGAAIVTADKACFVTDSRYTIQAKAEVQNMDVRSFSNPATFESTLGDALKDLGQAKVGFEQSLTYAAWQRRISEMSAWEWVPAPDMIQALRKVKSPEEVAKIREACKLADACMEHAMRMIAPGIKEYDISLDVEFFYRRHGAALAFEPIVVSGPNSAKPHGHATDRELQAGDFVTIDCGAKLDGYCSDITRTFVVGSASDRHREIYEQVLRAETECCARCVIGQTGKQVDAHARAILDEKQLAQYFGHGLGHGLGMDVHDPGSLSPRSTDTLEPGNVYTVEPGVYIDGFGGVRIEDDVHVTANGPEILTAFPKHLHEL